jgi:hypothetical protein
MTDFDTHSEGLFCHVCEERLGYGIDKIERTQDTTPDYKVCAHGVEIIAEVKQLDENPTSKAIRAELDGPGAMHIGDVDFEHTGHIDRVLAKQKRQLKSASQKGKPTLGVIYPNRFLGPDEYQVRAALANGTANFPPEISAVMLMKNSDISAEARKTPLYKIYTNPKADVSWPNDIFPEIYAL